MNRLSVTALAAAGLLAATAPALANVSASAVLGPLTVQLIDLDPLDGITPSLTFLAGTYGYGSTASASVFEPFGNANTNQYGALPWQSVSATATTSLATATGSVSGGANGSAAGVSLLATGSVQAFTSANPFDSASFSASASGPSGSFNEGFLLSANTLMVISAAATVQGQAAEPQGEYFYGNQFSANVSMQVSGVGPLGGGSQNANDGINIYGFNYPGYGALSLTDSRVLGLSFTNLTDSSMTGGLSMDVSVNGYTYANAVPEPGVAGMMLAGLAALGFVVRRRRA